MKKIIWLSFSELKQNFLFFLLSFILLTAILTVGLFVSSAANNMVQVFYDYANTLSPNSDGFSITLNGLHYSSADSIRNLPFNYVYPEFEDDIKTDEFSFNGKKLSDIAIYAPYVLNDNFCEVKEGIPFLKKYNNSEKAWVSEKTADELKCRVGDCIVHNLSESDKVQYEVAGIYKEDNTQYGIIIPFETYYNSETACGINVNHTVYGILADSRDYSSVCAKLKKMNISPFSILDDSFRAITFTDMLFRVLFVLIIIGGAWMFSNLCGIIFQNRFKFIMRMRILGFGTVQLALVYLIIFMLILMLSLLSSYILNDCFFVYTKNIIVQMFPNIECNFTDAWCQMTAESVLCVLILGISFRSLYRSINVSDLISSLEEKR